MLQKIIVACAIIVWGGYSSTAQTTFLKVEDAWKYADEHNVSIRNSQFDLQRTQAAEKQAKMAFLPTITAQGTYTENTSIQTTLIPAAIFGGADGTYRAVQFGQKYIYNGSITAQLDLVNLQTWYNIGIVNTTRDLNTAAIANTRKGVYQQIASQYYNIILMMEAEQLAIRSHHIADSVYTSVLHKFEVGTVGKGNVDLAELNKERAEKELINAHYQAITATNNLKGLLDMGISDSLVIAGSLDKEVSGSAGASHLFVEDPSVKTAWFQKQLSLKQIQTAKGSYFPTLSLIYSNSTQQNDNVFRPFQGGPPWYPANYYTLRASWTLFNGGLRWLQVKKNKIGYEQSKMQYENTLKQSAITDENIKISYIRAEAMLEKSKHIMLLSLDNYQHITNKYEAGIASLDDRLNAFSDYINYQNQYLSSLSDLLVQLYNVKIRQQTF